ncbi:MAG: hypothetical protein GX137_01780 [Thermoplasmatales archaeon]|jgi:hypothetical protein|nr:hypothetical protein [Thermoplasmatales archaeon]
MTNKPSIVSTGRILAALGGIICIIGLALTFDADSKNILVEIGVPLASAVMFFAVCGGLSSDSCMKRGVIAFLSFLNIAVLAFVMIYGTMDLCLGAILILLALGVLISGASPSTARYIGTDRA